MNAGKRWKILAIDDEAGIRNLIKEALEPRWDVTLAVDGRDGLEQVKTLKPHLILLDLKMPGLDGLSVLAKLKANRQTNAIPVVIVSAKGDTESLIEGQRAGAVDHIIKPFQVEELRTVVQRQLSWRGD
jgi:DNA-binding response OmpR family regulator